MSSCLKRIVGGVAIVAAVALLVPAGMSAQEEGGPGRYMVQFRDFGRAAEAVRAAGGSPIHEFPELGVVAAWLPEPALAGLSHNPNVVAIEVDPPRYPMLQTTPYGISMVQADQVSDAAAANRKICIIDSGYYAGHEDLGDSGVTASFNSGTGDPFTDLCGHGSHVAGTISAINNSAGVVGVLPNQRINLHIVKVFGDDCVWAYSSDLINALQQCRDNGANVVSMSLGGGTKSIFEESAFNNAWNAGLLSVAAAGNGGNTAYSYPASYGSVVSVAAVDSTKTVAGFSQKNNQVDLAAPGVAVLSSVPWQDTNSVTSGGTTASGTWIEFAARTGAGGVTGTLVGGGLCNSVGSWGGAVVLCERGSISFFDKVRNVQSGGGVAAVIYNNVAGGFSGTLGAGNSSTIPAIGISQADGQTLAGTRLGQSSTVVSISQKPASGYEAWDGTSMATPHVSGVAALVWSYNSGWTNAQIRSALESTAQDLGTAGRDNSYGWGLVQAKAALDSLTGAPPPTSTPTPAVSTPTPTPTPAVSTPTPTRTPTWTPPPASTPTPTRTATAPPPTATPTRTPTAPPASTPTATRTPTPSGAITLSASGYKVKGLQKADLSWQPTGAGMIDVYRNGAVIFTTPHDGFQTDPINARGSGSYTYRVCVSGSSTCSNTATVTF